VLGDRNTAYPPNEVLQRLEGAPRGADFDDAYHSWTDALPRHLRLPDSDMLKAIHTYASDFYGHSQSATNSLLSMDGTALIASAVLLEELVAESLQKSGNLVFSEAKGEDSGEQHRFWNGMAWVEHHLPADSLYMVDRRTPPETCLMDETSDTEDTATASDTASDTELTDAEATDTAEDTTNAAGNTPAGESISVEHTSATESISAASTPIAQSTPANESASAVGGPPAVGNAPHPLATVTYQGMFTQLQQSRRAVQHIAADLGRRDSLPNTNTQAALTHGRSHILSEADRERVRARIRDIETEMEAKRQRFNQGQ
jgi:hypothetical protein